MLLGRPEPSTEKSPDAPIAQSHRVTQGTATDPVYDRFSLILYQGLAFQSTQS